jgi:hypothetical protein
MRRYRCFILFDILAAEGFEASDFKLCSVCEGQVFEERERHIRA